ncbi:hypothetical protein HUK65_14510 [Rhodobacteraceae bacterium 2376]|uniref:Uncharacterized protein n=1 Tax=Rhabdonatronobacter sediminivivens TaxID=2743469 RepID=A0A7Z0I2A6_9RHOB|nr:hypothetical protein [Rhabdonatronobacter sediminivivens]NYS26204.1 hypothetical protein [Rhabdonatronobacter sediminivivens]
MSQSVSSAHTAAPLRHSDPEPVLRIGNREIFWRPRRLRPSRWLEHLPFLFWLIADLRPRHCATLGLDTGVAHFALCQGVEKLGLEAVCHGFDTRKDGAIPADLLRYNEEHYDDFSRLEMGSGPPAMVEDGLDLVLVDRPLDAQMLAQLTNEWGPRMAQPGVTVLAGLEAAARDPDTAHALAGLQQRHSHVRFDHGGGLLALCHGAEDTGQDRARRVQRLAGLAVASPEHHVVHQVFRRLGQLNAAAHHADSESNRARRLEADLDQRAREQAAVEAALEELRDRHGTLSEAYDARHARMAGAEAELFDLREAVRAQTERGDRLQAELTTARNAQADLVAQLTARDRRLAEVTATQDQQAQAQAALEQSLAQRQDAVEKLIARLEAREEAYQAEVAAHQERSAAAEAAQAEMAAQMETMQAELEEANTRRKEFWRQGNELRDQRKALEAQLAEAETRATTAEAALTEAETRADTAEAQLGARDSALAEMAAQLETAQRSCTALQAQADERTAEIARLSDKLEKALVKRDALRKRIDLLVNSTSWRVTAPLRRVKTALSGSAEK